MVEWKIFRQDAVNILGEDKVSRGEQIYKGQFKEGRIDINKLFKILNKEGLLKPKQKKQIQTAFQQRSQEERNVTIANTPAKRNVPLTRINGTDETKTLHQPGKVPKTIETDEEEIDISAHLDGFDDEKATYIGKYKIIKELGRGGMGAVYLCEDPTFETVQREVAVKKLILPAKKAKNKQAQAELTTRTERAKREAGLTAILARHDNIIKIYDSGIDPTDNNFFYSMEVVNGKEWNDVLRTVAEIRRTNKPLPERYSLENMLETLLKVCDAMAYAHDQEIIHRDLKPENVMVDEKFGSVKVMDWGLAKKIDEADTLRLTQSKKTLEEYMKNMDVGRTITALTIDGQIMGTPKFMGPEQATNAKRLDQTADVYSLGAMLYNVLTGKPPIVTKGSIWNLIKKIKAGDITPPIKSKNPLYQIPPEINAITMKALAKDKRNRYQTAKELAKDIRAFLTNKEVSSYPYTFSEKAARFVQKHATATIATLLLTLGLGISGVAYQSFRAADARADAETARAEKADLEKKIEKQKRKKAEKRAVKAEDAYEGQSEAINKLQSLEQLTQNEDYYDAALQIINEAVHESKNFWQPYLARAKHYATFGHYTEAEEDFEKAQILYKKQHQKESVEIWFEAGMQYGLPAGLGGQGESDKALQYFEKAVQIGPKTVWGKLSRAVSQIIHAKKNPEDAWELIPDALEATSNLNQDTVAKNITATQLVYAWIKGASVISKYKYPVFFEYADLPEA
ncbi:protein kinase, partial [Candidatus Woesearchaeota archaeon]|nr:protein kinase [Candidatus Woesearchaeota archaeon]